jgi:RNA polymerase sigma-70 factor, ECF subfamily
MAERDVTLLLADAAGGDRRALDALLPLVYDELRRLAASQMSHERAGHTLGTTGLINEAYLRLVAQKTLDIRSRGMFFGIAATTMRRVLVDHARGRNREKRGGDLKRESFTTAIEFAEGKEGVGGAGSPVDVLELDEALEELSKLNERCARLVELRFFVGMSVDDAAEAVGVSPRQAANEWKVARAFLAERLVAAR